MELRANPQQVQVSFREIRLPRSVQHAYPRDSMKLADEWERKSGILVALHDEQPIGYVCMINGMVADSTWVTDLAVIRRLRRQGIGTALLLAAQEWASQQNTLQTIVEMQSKNYPAICLVQKLGFDFCGYSDRYYPNQDIALFFAKTNL
jgi:GNAT superfamily N-acetyltransferase